MALRSLRPHLNEIRTWVEQGRTDAWIAHQLEVTVQEIEQFKRQNELAGEEGGLERTGPPARYPDEIDLRAEDDALIASELEAAMQAERARAESEETGEEGAQASIPRPRRRAHRPRRAATREVVPLEGTFDHGEEGYGLWLDPAVQDNPIYAEHWAGHRAVEVTISEDAIVIRRAGEEE